jgi:hypothetical protein
MYKKRGRLDIDVESANNEEQCATQFYNFMRKHPHVVISQVSIPQINLDIGTASPRAVPAPSRASSTPDPQKALWMTSLNLTLAHYSMSKKALAVLKPNKIIRNRTDASCSSFHLRVFLGLSNPRDRGRLALYLYRVITLVKEKLSLT